MRMLRHLLRRPRDLVWGLVLAACLAVPVPAVAATVYTFGVVPQFSQRKLFAVWQPIIEELDHRTGLDIRLKFTLTIPEFEAKLEKGAFDFVYTNPYHIMRVADTMGYIPLVRDKAALRGILVVRKDSPIKNVKELQGKTLAVPSPNALGASLLLRADLARLYGVHMVMVNVKTHTSSYLHVLNRLTAAGGGVQKTLAEQPEDIRNALRVLYTTRAMPSHPISALPRVPEPIRQRVKQALLAMGASPAGKALLSKVPMPDPVPANIDEYLVMRKWGLDRYWVKRKK